MRREHDRSATSRSATQRLAILNAPQGGMADDWGQIVTHIGQDGMVHDWWQSAAGKIPAPPILSWESGAKQCGDLSGIYGTHS